MTVRRGGRTRIGGRDRGERADRRRDDTWRVRIFGAYGSSASRPTTQRSDDRSTTTRYIGSSSRLGQLRPFPAVFGPIIELQIPLLPHKDNAWQGASERRGPDDCKCVSRVAARPSARTPRERVAVRAAHGPARSNPADERPSRCRLFVSVTARVGARACARTQPKYRGGGGEKT